jgi:Zn-dependent protease
VVSLRASSRWAGGQYRRRAAAAGVVSVAGPEAIYGLNQPRAAFWAALTFLAYLQFAAALLNLCPIPGLDGYGMAEPYLPEGIRRVGARLRLL